jgi:hypothetical protein
MTAINYEDHGVYVSSDELKAKGVKNLQNSLPLAPCVKHKVNGRIFSWHGVWAKRPDIFVCCDENGNEDEASWVGRAPSGYGGAIHQPPTPRYKPKETPTYANNVIGQKFIPPV